MSLTSLNPIVRSVRMYERINRTDECVAYDSRLIYILSGDVIAVVGGEKLGHITTGEMLYIPAGMPYKLKGQYVRAVVVAHDPTDEYGVYEEIGAVATADFKREMCHAVKLPPFNRVIRLSESESLREPLETMVNIAIASEGEYRAELSARLKLILLTVAEATDENALPARMVEALGEYIRENVGEELSNTEVGAIFGYHPFYISKVLKAAKGQTLRQYIISYRLKRARCLLQSTARSIAEIADECGFTDASYFTKTFRSVFGMTPKEYRNEFKDDFI